LYSGLAEQLVVGGGLKTTVCSVEGSKCVEDLTTEVSGRPGVTCDPARFEGTVFRFGAAEIGHVDLEGSVHIPLPRPVPELLAPGTSCRISFTPITYDRGLAARYWRICGELTASRSQDLEQSA